MSLLSADAGIRAQLHSDIAAAWNPNKLYDDTPRLPNSPADLPIVFCILQGVTPARSGPGAGAKDVSCQFKYTLTKVSALPAGVILDAVKIADIHALTDRLLTANQRYAGWKRDIGEIRFDTDALDTGERVYTVEFDFTLTVITNG